MTHLTPLEKLSESCLPGNTHAPGFGHVLRRCAGRPCRYGQDRDHQGRFDDLTPRHGMRRWVIFQTLDVMCLCVRV